MAAASRSCTGKSDTDPIVVRTAECRNPSQSYKVFKAGLTDDADILVFIDHPYDHYCASIIEIDDSKLYQPKGFVSIPYDLSGTFFLKCNRNVTII